METFGVLFEDDIRNLLFADTDPDDGSKYDVNSIFDESSINHIMESEMNSPDNGFSSCDEYNNLPEATVYNNTNNNLLQSQLKNLPSSFDEFVSSITSLDLPLNLPGIVQNGTTNNTSKSYMRNSVTTMEQYLPSCSMNETNFTVPVLPVRSSIYSKIGQQMDVTRRTFDLPIFHTTSAIKKTLNESSHKNISVTQVGNGITQRDINNPHSKKASLVQRSTKYKHRKIRSRPNKCYHLWDFLRDLLTLKVYPEHKCVMWMNEKDEEFLITDTKLLASLWGDHKSSKSSKNMTYDKLSRTIRYYCTLDILKKIDGKRLQFKFSKGKMWSKGTL